MEGKNHSKFYVVYDYVSNSGWFRNFFLSFFHVSYVSCWIFVWVKKRYVSFDSILMLEMYRE